MKSDGKGTRNRIVPVAMYDEIYVREGKGIELPHVTSDVLLSSERGILVDFLFSFFIFLTHIIGHVLLLQS